MTAYGLPARVRRMGLAIPALAVGIPVHGVEWPPEKVWIFGAVEVKSSVPIVIDSHTRLSARLYPLPPTTGRDLTTSLAEWSPSARPENRFVTLEVDSQPRHPPVTVVPDRRPTSVIDYDQPVVLDFIGGVHARVGPTPSIDQRRIVVLDESGCWLRSEPADPSNPNGDLRPLRITSSPRSLAALS